ncbi:urea carboxylase [Oceanobacillus oncorhynchi subsp. incaldanensis]|uniref:KipI antagonist n=2 Tax=Oceanobacillus TaxID=182709 RepID=A0A0A1MD98_9BACI|nr:biotin-dependent carboxyltransferase family protein [Oceanobacillus oncorhynchi]MDM8101987.1 biotin-dependent carboxyltransferase family protein [Oceanobacillus oncorhynchi]GIO18023.1 urea carboxylase [Oceanobacillus oncorhynchi subsp. incaldanensis]CEI81073.1 KipI antagonist [Oceanobacillus oncorhynchi]
MKEILEVMKPGLSTSIQDTGRIGYQKYGIPTAGAMDTFAHRIANLLVGNPEEAATLEIMLMGPRLKFLQDAVIAVGGADLSAAVDGEPVCPWKSFRVYTGQILSFGKPVHGTYAYLAVSGGFYAETVMGSKSTYAQANLGGIEGRILQKGDRLSAEDKNLKSIRAGRYLKKTDIPNYEQHRPIRVITGPDISAFSDTIYQQFLQESYRITEQSNRMGYRLEGKALSHVDKADIISDAVLPGTIQVPANGQPIVLLADRQTTGGYARIATVIAADIPQLVQKKIGAEVRFLSVPLERAHADYLAQQRYFKILRTAVRSEE